MFLFIEFLQFLNNFLLPNSQGCQKLSWRINVSYFLVYSFLVSDPAKGGKKRESSEK